MESALFWTPEYTILRALPRKAERPIFSLTRAYIQILDEPWDWLTVHMTVAFAEKIGRNAHTHRHTHTDVTSQTCMLSGSGKELSTCGAPAPQILLPYLSETFSELLNLFHCPRENTFHYNILTDLGKNNNIETQFCTAHVFAFFL